MADLLVNNPTSDPSVLVEQLYEQYANRLVQVAGRMLKNTQDAEDVVNDVFVRLWTNLQRPSHIRNIHGWLHTAVRHGSIDFRRRKANQGIQTDLSQFPAPHPSISRGELHELIATKADSRAAEVFLRHLDGNRNKDIAQEWSVSDATISKLLTKARTVLCHAASSGLLTLVATIVLPWLQRILWDTWTTVRRLRRRHRRQKPVFYPAQTHKTALLRSCLSAASDTEEASDSEQHRQGRGGGPGGGLVHFESSSG